MNTKFISAIIMAIVLSACSPSPNKLLVKPFDETGACGVIIKKTFERRGQIPVYFEAKREDGDICEALVTTEAGQNGLSQWSLVASYTEYSEQVVWEIIDISSLPGYLPAPVLSVKEIVPYANKVFGADHACVDTISETVAGNIPLYTANNANEKCYKKSSLIQTALRTLDADNPVEQVSSEKQCMEIAQRERKEATKNEPSSVRTSAWSNTFMVLPTEIGKCEYIFDDSISNDSVAVELRRFTYTNHRAGGISIESEPFKYYEKFSAHINEDGTYEIDEGANTHIVEYIKSIIDPYIKNRLAEVAENARLQEEFRSSMDNWGN